MNMILHNNPTALIVQGNTLADPRFTDGDTLKTLTTWSPIRPSATSAGAPASTRPTIRERFSPSVCRPPSRATTPTCCISSALEEHRQGRASCRTACSSGAMPRPTSAAPGPQGLHQGHHRPAHQPVLRHWHPRLHHRRRQGGRPHAPGHLHDRRQQHRMKDGPKNRLRAQDIHKIVDVFTRQLDVPYSRLVSFAEIEKMSSTSTCRATSTAQGQRTYRTSRDTCAAASPTATSLHSKNTGAFSPGSNPPSSIRSRDDYSQLSILHSQLKQTIYAHPEFVAFTERMNAPFAAWRQREPPRSRPCKLAFPKEVIAAFAEDLLALRRQAAHRQIRRLPAPDGLLGGDHAGRLLPHRR